MADASQSLDARRIAREQEGRIAASASMGLNAAKPFVQFQTSMLRLWPTTSSCSLEIMKRASKHLAPPSSSNSTVNKK